MSVYQQDRGNMYKCSSHSVLQRKPKDDFNDVLTQPTLLQYANCISSLSLQKASIQPHFVNILKTFPNLMDLSLVLCKMDSLTGISKARHLRDLNLKQNRYVLILKYEIIMYIKTCFEIV